MRGLLTFGLSCLLAAPAAALEAPHYADDTAAFLASHDSDYMTGQLLMIDGGMVVQ